MILLDEVVVVDDDYLVGLLASSLIIASGEGADTVADCFAVVALSRVLALRLVCQAG